jgi:hypothetical protein
VTRRIAITLLLALACVVTRVEGASREITAVLRPGTRDALGLGGDPFRSPLRDEDGWWAEPEFDASPHVGVVSRTSEPIGAGAGAGGHLSAGETEWRLRGSTILAGRRLMLAGRVSDVRWMGAVDAMGGQLALSRAGVGPTAAARLENVVPGLTAQTAFPIWIEDERVSAGGASAGLRYRPIRGVAAQAVLVDSRLPDAFRSDLYGQPVATSLNLRSRLARMDARVRLPARLAVEASVGRERYTPRAPRSEVTAYQLAPEGESGLDQYSLEWAARAGWRVLARRTEATFDVGGEASWGGERFGQLDYARGGLRSTLVALESAIGRSTRLIVDGELASASLRARGVIETWPFTPTLVDLLGLRRIARIEGHASWHRVHAALERSVADRGRLRLGASWFDVRPEGSLESWRPAFLVFGRADDHVDRLGFDRAQLAEVSVGLNGRLGSLEWGMALDQFVFAKTFASRPTVTAGEASPPSAMGTATSAMGRGWPGGTTVEVSIGRRW